MFHLIFLLSFDELLLYGGEDMDLGGQQTRVSVQSPPITCAILSKLVSLDLSFLIRKIT